MCISLGMHILPESDARSGELGKFLPDFKYY